MAIHSIGNPIRNYAECTENIMQLHMIEFKRDRPSVGLPTVIFYCKWASDFQAMRFIKYQFELEQNQSSCIDTCRSLVLEMARKQLPYQKELQNDFWFSETLKVIVIIFLKGEVIRSNVPK